MARLPLHFRYVLLCSLERASESYFSFLFVWACVDRDSFTMNSHLHLPPSPRLRQKSALHPQPLLPLLPQSLLPLPDPLQQQPRTKLCLIDTAIVRLFVFASLFVFGYISFRSSAATQQLRLLQAACSCCFEFAIGDDCAANKKGLLRLAAAMASSSAIARARSPPAARGCVASAALVRRRASR